MKRAVAISLLPLLLSCSAALPRWSEAQVERAESALDMAGDALLVLESITEGNEEATEVLERLRGEPRPWALSPRRHASLEHRGGLGRCCP